MRDLSALADPAQFVISPSARDFAVWMVLDSFTVALAGARLEPDVVGGVGATMRRMSGPGPAAAFPLGHRLMPAAAAAVNACAIHSIDFDDSYMAGGVKAHFSASIVPAALAVAEETRATGRALIDAIVIGFEAAGRLGHALAPEVVRRWHPTGVIGVVGCSAAACALYGLRDDQAEMALGLAADHAAGTRFCLASGDATKSLHAAFAAHDGIMSAQMASEGVGGPLGFLTGMKGFCDTYLDGSAVALGDLALSPDPEGRALIELNCTKFYPVMHALHAAAAVCVELAAKRSSGRALSRNLSPDDIVSIEVTQSTTHASFGAYFEPDTVLAARLSLPYTVAATLLDGTCGLDQFTRERLREPAFRALMQRVRIVASDDLERTYGSRVASNVRVAYSDGTTTEGFAADPLGFPERPATSSQRLDKAMVLLTRVMSTASATEVVDAIRTLPELDSVTPLTDLLLDLGVLP